MHLCDFAYFRLDASLVRPARCCRARAFATKPSFPQHCSSYTISWPIHRFPFFCQPHANLGGQHWDRVTCSKVRWGWGEEEILLAPHVPKQTGMAARKTALARDDAAKRRGVQSPALQPLLPFRPAVLCHPDTYMWFDVDGHAHEVLQGEGGEQGDPRMPALYVLAQYQALVKLQSQLLDGEAVFAFLDDVYIVALPNTFAPFMTCSSKRFGTARGFENKTRIWNAAAKNHHALPNSQCRATGALAARACVSLPS